MPAMLILAVVAMGLVLAVLAAVVAGIRQEPSSQQLNGEAPRLMAKMTRRLVGVYVRRPDPSVIPEKQRHGAMQHTVSLAERTDTRHKIRDI
jgi:K+-sensing histidine kinase KdpD